MTPKQGHKAPEMKKKIIALLGLKFNVTQYKWGRKLFGGTWYQIYVIGIPLTRQIFWSDKIITSCQSKVINTEVYETN